MHVTSFQFCLTLCDHMDCSLPGSSVCGLLQARILECVAISSSRGSSQPRDWTQVSYVSYIGRWGLQSLVSCPAPHPCAPSQSSCSPRAVRCTTLDSLCPYFCVFLWISLDKPCLIFWVTVWFSRLQGINLSSLTCFVSFTYATLMLHHLNERK